MFVAAGIALKQAGAPWPAVGLGLRILVVAVSIGFGLVADRLAWKARPDRDPTQYSKSGRIWALGTVVYALFLVGYRPGL